MGNVALATIGTQTPLEFTYDASQNNNINTMGLAIEMTDGNLDEKKVEIKDFLLLAVNNDGNSLVSTPLVSSDDSTTWSNYKSGTPSENQDDYQDDIYWSLAARGRGLCGDCIGGQCCAILFQWFERLRWIVGTHLWIGRLYLGTGRYSAEWASETADEYLLGFRHRAVRYGALCKRQYRLGSACRWAYSRAYRRIFRCPLAA